MSSLLKGRDSCAVEKSFSSFILISFLCRITNPPNMNCIIPCDLRSNPANIVMGNQISHLCLELPMNIEGNIPLLWSLNDNTKRVKQNGDYATMYLFTHIIYLLFPFCLGKSETEIHFIGSHRLFLSLSLSSQPIAITNLQ